MTVSLSDTQKRILVALLHASNNNEIGLTRDRLMDKLNLARTTVYDNLFKLRNLKIIDKTLLHKETRGRPLVLWYLNKDSKLKTYNNNKFIN